MNEQEQVVLNPIVSQDWLKDNIDDANLVIVDCRFQLGQPNAGADAYKESHIPRALYFHLEEDLSAPVGEHGGRHPLPDLEQFVQKLSNIGIDPSKTVIAYDDQGGAMAARLWWMLHLLGHSQAHVLDQGFSAWKAKGYPVTDEIPAPTASLFVPNLQESMLVTMDEVKQKLGDERTILIDSRAKERYTGEMEDIDPVAGHIPGARLEFWKDSLTADGSWKSAEEQKERLAHYVQEQDKDIILYCGSGVTACANVIAFKQAGLEPKLYAGSWSDWISYKDNPIATGQE